MTSMSKRVVAMMNRMMESYDRSGPAKKAMISAFLHYFPGQITCKEFDDFMSDYLDGTLPERERRRFDFHLEACPMCRHHLESYRAAVALARASADDSWSEAPRELVNAILAARDTNVRKREGPD